MDQFRTKNPMDNFLPDLTAMQAWGVLSAILMAIFFITIKLFDIPVDFSYNWHENAFQNLWAFFGLLIVNCWFAAIWVWGPLQSAGWVGKKRKDKPDITYPVVLGGSFVLIAFITLLVLTVNTLA